MRVGSAEILYVQGRQHKVKIYHCANSQLDYVEAAMRTFFQIHIDMPQGDVLIFLPGQEDIESLEASIKLYASRLPINHPTVCSIFCAAITLLIFLYAGANMHNVRCSRAFAE